MGAEGLSQNAVMVRERVRVHQLDEAGFAQAWEEGRVLTADAAVALALDSLG